MSGDDQSGCENATATLDPLFTIDLPLNVADQYHIFFSDGVGNGATNAATPLPAALPWKSLLVGFCVGLVRSLIGSFGSSPVRFYVAF